MEQQPIYNQEDNDRISDESYDVDEYANKRECENYENLIASGILYDESDTESDSGFDDNMEKMLISLGKTLIKKELKNL